jgi:hypothetical protein
MSFADMRKFALAAAGVALVMVSGFWKPAAAPAEASASVPLAAWHFAGTEALRGDTNATHLRKILAQPSSEALIEATLQKLAATPERLFSAQLKVPQPAPSTLVRPLLSDLMRVESWVALGGNGTGVTELAVAARLDVDTSTRWENRWQALMAAFGIAKPATWHGSAGEGWRASWNAGATVSHFFRKDGWTFVSLGRAPLTAETELAKRAGSTPPSTGGWLDLEANLPALAKVFGVPATPDWPQLQLSVTGRGANVRSTARLNFASDLNLKLDPWRIPTNTISDPIISFTAVRGLGAWLTDQPTVRQLGVPAPNQVFGWGLAQVPFETFLAWAWPGASNALPALAERLPATATNWFPRIHAGRIGYETNYHRLAWTGLPILVPFLRPADAPDDDFVLAGVFPVIAKHRPAPPELFDQLNSSSNLVYYEWEITQHRLDDWRNLTAMRRMLSNYLPPATNSPAVRWPLDTNVTRLLGNSVTTVSMAAPRELEAVRTSSAGLIGFELVLLLRWLDDPAFPKLTEPPSVFSLPHPKGKSRPPAPAAVTIRPVVAPPPMPAVKTQSP